MSFFPQSFKPYFLYTHTILPFPFFVGFYLLLLKSTFLYPKPTIFSFLCFLSLWVISDSQKLKSLSFSMAPLLLLSLSLLVLASASPSPPPDEGNSNLESLFPVLGLSSFRFNHESQI